MSTVEVGKYFNRDHTTVMHATERWGGSEVFRELKAELDQRFPKG